MSEKMTAEEWHKLAAKSLVEENEKLMDKLIVQMNQEGENQHKRQQQAHEANLRDHFAGLALQGLCASTPSGGYILDKFDYVTEAYELADMMLTHRKGFSDEI